MLRASARMTGLDDLLSAESKRFFDLVDDAVAGGSDGLKADLRNQTEGVLGGRLALTWRNRFYANKGDAKGPAGFIWSKAPRIISFFSADRVITPLGKFLAIPAAGVVGSRGRRATVADVERRFGPLKFIPFKDGNAGLFADLTRGRSRGKRRGSKPQLTLMFTLVRTLRSQKLVDLEATADRWGAKIADDIDHRLGSS